MRYIKATRFRIGMKKIDDYTLDLYEKLYFHEIELREKIIGRLQITLSIIFPILGGISYLILNFENKHDNNSFIFIGLLFLCLIFIFISLYLFSKSWHGHKLTVLPTALDILKFIKDINLQNWSNEKKQLEFNDYLKESFAKSATDNTITNAKKSKLLKRTNKALISSSLFLIICFFLFSYYELDKTPKVNISNPISLTEYRLPYNQIIYLYPSQSCNKYEDIKCQKKNRQHVKKSQHNQKKNHRPNQHEHH